ncbi:RICIN domain-containing protein [Streptomyces sp. URMC 124]|uniref:RICIN domain-containing protein n=1 Tax=Streptomyces sp. URMC 124 TaxID=3423405 RepID=UPI003F1C1528
MAASGAALVLTAPGVGQAAGRGDLLVNTMSLRCLEIDNSSRSNGALAQQWACKGQAGAVWKFVKVAGSGTGSQYRIVNANSGKCLEIADSRKDAGAPIQQWTCVDGVATQLWYEDRGTLLNKNAGLAVSLPEPGEPGDVGPGGGRVVQPNLQDGARAVAGVAPQIWDHWDPAYPPAPVQAG